MNRTVALLAAALGLALSPLHAATDQEVEARRVSLELAGAFRNDGFKLRDGVWQGTLAPGKSQVIQVNLYAGNEYWFSLGTTGAPKKLALHVFDETGAPVDAEGYEKGSTAAAGFSPGSSGPYYVQVELPEGDAVAFCLVYSYK